MTWTTLHMIAQTIELWSSLILNIWIILGAIRLLVVRTRDDELTREAVTDALIWSLVVVLWTVVVLGNGVGVWALYAGHLWLGIFSLAAPIAVLAFMLHPRGRHRRRKDSN